MDKSQIKQFGPIVSGIAEAYGREASPAMINIYVLALQHLEFDDFMAAVREALQTDKQFMPTPARLLELASGGSVEDRALQAWIVVDRTVERVGGYRSVDFADPVINAVIRSMGGWVSFSGKSVEEFDKWTRKEFLEAYRRLASAGVNGDVCRPLMGLSTGGDVRHIDGRISHVPEPHVALIDVPYKVPERKRIGNNNGAATVPRLELRKP